MNQNVISSSSNYTEFKCELCKKLEDNNNLNYCKLEKHNILLMICSNCYWDAYLYNSVKERRKDIMLSDETIKELIKKFETQKEYHYNFFEYEIIYEPTK